MKLEELQAGAGTEFLFHYTDAVRADAIIEERCFVPGRGQRAGSDLATHRVRALWPRLELRQQQIVLDPSKTVGHRYPLTSGEVAGLTQMSERQVRYWADRGLIPHWRKGRRRLFKAVGLIAAFSITNASQHELQFYRGVIEEPVEKLAAKVGILTSLLASRLDGAEPDEANALTASLGELSRR